MITLKPDRKLKDKFPKIDYHSLSLVYSLLYDSACISKRRKNFDIYICTSNGDCSYYNWRWPFNVKLYISHHTTSLRVFHAAMLHEFRHFLQDNIFKIPLSKRTYDETTHNSYMASPVEIDARAYEKQLLSKVIRLYERLNKQKENIKYISSYKGKSI